MVRYTNGYIDLKCIASKTIRDQMHSIASCPSTISPARAAVGVLRLSWAKPEAAVLLLHKAAVKLQAQT